MDRSCGTCTKCCEGHLKANINGVKMGLGKACYLLELGKGCSDYDNRPYMPCKWYRCEWLKNEEIPDNFKPNEVNFILRKQWKNGIEYESLIPAGDIIKEEDVELFMNWIIKNNKNTYFTINNKEYIYGSKEFLREVKR